MGDVMYYEIKGSGECVLLLHGWGLNSKMMQFISDDLCSSYQVINVDLPGFGNSKLDQVYDIKDYCLAIKKLLDSLNINEVYIVAHSFGARIAFEYALNYVCKGLFLSGAAGIKDNISMSKKVSQRLYKCFKWLPLKWGSSDYQMANPIMKQVLVKCVNQDYLPLLKNIKIPVRLFWGNEDKQTPLWMGKKILEEMPQATMRIIYGGDHFAFKEHQALFLYDLKKFLKEGSKHEHYFNDDHFNIN